jgi:tRNA A-37 threonylcarbamoyl transferase component Bud32/tetratricopeptide (TPR) repeat protein
MSSVASSHPDLDQVRRFGLGQLVGAEAQLVENHVAGCDWCAALLQQAPDDTLIGLLRGRETDSDDRPPAVPPVPNPAPDSGYTAGTEDMADTPDLPAALREHPRYRVLRLLGRGGMGTVYLAEHRHMGRLVALKVIKPSLLEDSVAVRRFRQEVRTVARLWHPNIVQADDADQAGGLHFLVMEYLEGQSLHEYLQAHGPLPAAEACDDARQAALGLQHAHERGLTHRDVKPHNLLRTPAGQIKILDFGLAGVVGEREAPSAALTGAGTTIGTADYMAPEQARDSHAADIRADIYALGCTLYHLLAGRPPFPGPGTPVEKILRHVTDEPTPLRQLRADLPADLDAVVARMMAKDPADRYQTPAEVAAALAAVCSQPAGGCPPALPPPAGNGLPRRRVPAGFRHGKGPRRAGVAAVAAALLVTAAGLAAAVVFRLKADDSRRQLVREKEQVQTLRAELARQQQQTEAALRREQEAGQREAQAREAAERSRQAELTEMAASDYRNATALLQQGKVPEAIKYLREAVALKPEYPEAHCHLGFALQRQGQFAEAVPSLKRGDQFGRRDPHWRQPSEQWVQDAEHLVVLDGKLPALVRGDARPADEAECLEVVRICRLKKWYAAVVRFSAEAFRRRPELAEDLGAGHRSNAAGAAVLAGTGQGDDPAKPDDAERARLRRQALDWLKADLAAWARQAAVGKPPGGRNGPSWWQQDPDLAGVRVAAGLALLPAAERPEWRQFWAEVAAQLADPRALP